MKNRIIISALFVFVSLLLVSCSREAPPLPPPPEAPEYVSLNEIYSNGTEQDPDWIELYNNATFQIDIGGYKMYDTGGNDGSKPKMTFPAGTMIPALGFLVVVVDDTTDAGFGLSKNGDEVWLENASGEVLEHVVVPALEATQSYGKTIEGGTAWQVWDQVTRGTPNNGSGAVVVDVMMNEAFSRGVPEAPDWVEIYNPNTVAVNLTGYTIYDGAGNAGTKEKKQFPAGAVVPALGFYVIVTDDSETGNFGLGSGGDEIWLENSSGVVIDHVQIPAMPIETTSYCRIPDGSDNWQISNTVTRGASNQA